MTVQEKIAIAHNVMAFGPFSASNLAATQSDQAAALPATNTSVAMPIGGSVVGITGKLSAAATAGTLLVGVTVDGVEDADSVQTITTLAEFYASFQEGQIPFSAGANIGIEWNTDGDWNGTGSDIDVYVLVLLKDMEF